MAVFANLREYLHAFRLLARVLILNLVRTAGYRMDTYRYGTDRHQYGVIIRPKAGQEKRAVIFSAMAEAGDRGSRACSGL